MPSEERLKVPDDLLVRIDAALGSRSGCVLRSALQQLLVCNQVMKRPLTDREHAGGFASAYKETGIGLSCRANRWLLSEKTSLVHRDRPPYSCFEDGAHTFFFPIPPWPKGIPGGNTHVTAANHFHSIREGHKRAGDNLLRFSV